MYYDYNNNISSIYLEKVGKDILTLDSFLPTFPFPLDFTKKSHALFFPLSVLLLSDYFQKDLLCNEILFFGKTITLRTP